MTLVYITHHNENVRDYDKVGQAFERSKPLKYISMHKKAVKKQINLPYVKIAPDGVLLIADAGKHERRTMGCAKTPLDPPQRFLRKHEGLKWRRLHDHICPKAPEIPPVPKVSEMPPKIICGPKKKAHKEKHDKPKEKHETPREVPKEKPEASKEKIETPREKKDVPKESKCNTPKPLPRCKTEISLANPCQNPDSRRKPETPKTPTCKVEQPCRTAAGCDACGLAETPKKSGKTEKAKPKKPRDPCKRINFIALNIKRMKNAQTKRPPPRYIDTPTGETHDLINSGLIPQHVCGRNFAKVPCYIREHKKLIKKYNETCAPELQTLQHCTEFMKKQGVRKMTLEERVALLDGLKANYLEQLKIFQALSLYTDTPTKKLRKGRLEKDLDQLELDIKFIQDNAVIYVSEY